MPPREQTNRRVLPFRQRETIKHTEATVPDFESVIAPEETAAVVDAASNVISLAVIGQEREMKLAIGLFRQNIYDAALEIVHSPEEADEIVQEVSLIALDQVLDIKPEQTFLTWLKELTSNLAWQRLREIRSEARQKVGRLETRKAHSLVRSRQVEPNEQATEIKYAANYAKN